MYVYLDISFESNDFVEIFLNVYYSTQEFHDEFLIFIHSETLLNIHNELTETTNYKNAKKKRKQSAVN